MAQRLSGRARVQVGEGTATLRISAAWSELSGCAGALGSDEAELTLPDSAGSWVRIPGRVLRAPVGAVSANIAFEVSTPSGSPFVVHLDELSCLGDVLFTDGFEGGDPNAWPATLP